MKSQIAHDIKHREKPNDEFETPVELAENLVKLVPLTKEDIVMDNAVGGGNFLKALRKSPALICNASKSFFDMNKKQHWLVTNPPYSKLDKWLEHSCEVSIKGFAYLFGLHNLTPKRIELCERKGFYISKIHMCKVFKWFGISAFIVWEKKETKSVEMTYDRIVWR